MGKYHSDYVLQKGRNQLEEVFQGMDLFVQTNFAALKEAAAMLHSECLQEVSEERIKIKHPEKGVTILTPNGVECVWEFSPYWHGSFGLDESRLNELDSIISVLGAEYEKRAMLPPTSPLLMWIKE